MRKILYLLLALMMSTAINAQEIENYCRAELLGGKERKSIGFNQ